MWTEKEEGEGEQVDDSQLCPEEAAVGRGAHGWCLSCSELARGWCSSAREARPPQPEEVAPRSLPLESQCIAAKIAYNKRNKF